MSDFLFRGSLEDLDPDLYRLTQLESERQYRRIILIPSESSAALAVREALASAFQNVYAEGYPSEDTRQLTEAEILDAERMLGDYRRYSDPRYYKGVEYVDIVEPLARRRCAALFAHNGVSPDEIYVNLQALSGGPANNAVYHALVEPGDTVMGMDLLHGGHLSHGSKVNRSGKYYNIVHYTVDPDTEQIDYDAVETLAKEAQPRMIIAGYSSYSWAPDWGRFRQIADSVGAYLLADIAHIAGMVAASTCNSPVGIADVIMFTTHKSMCGPRGAAILTTSRQLARKIDRAVFPGEQGGPHINTIAAQATAFKLANTDQFRQLQAQVLENSLTITETLQQEGFRIAYGGTNTHLTNIDCKSVVGVDGTTLSGDMAARILDAAGIVVNRNTIPGDRSALRPSGVRLGTHWITERGFKEKETRELGVIIADILKACEPYSLMGRRRPLQRAKIDFDALNDARLRVRDLAERMAIDFEPTKTGYPHFYYIDDPIPDAPFVTIEMEGDEAGKVLRWTTCARPEVMNDGEASAVHIHAAGGKVDGVLSRIDHRIFRLTVPSDHAGRTLTWLRDLSDGYIHLDPADLPRKAPGPFAVRLIGPDDALPDIDHGEAAKDKPWDLCTATTKGNPLPDFTWEDNEPEEVLKTALNETHRKMGAKMVPFAGWDMPVWYTSVIDEHLATRHAAGLFDVSHMGVYQVEGKNACAFLDTVVTNDVSLLDVGESLYTQFLDPNGHVIDDLMVYRRRPEMYLVVVNAANDDKDWAWLNAVKTGTVCVDRDRPWAKSFGRDCTLRNLRDRSSGKDMRVDIALQGPKSRDILLAMGCNDEAAVKLMSLPWAGVMEGEFGGIDLVVSRTGYTGERIAFELFVHPDESVKLWKDLLKVGEPFGIQAVGLGARDSLRTEAGLPLYGHEMAGEHDLSVGEAGFAAYVKTYKPWFIGRAAFLEQEAERDREMVRFRFSDKGVRMAHYDDPVVDKRGRVIGFVTSCAVDQDGYLLGQACLLKKYTSAGTPIAVYQHATEKAGKAPAELSVGDRSVVPTPAEVLTRFPKR